MKAVGGPADGYVIEVSSGDVKVVKEVIYVSRARVNMAYIGTKKQIYEKTHRYIPEEMRAISRLFDPLAKRSSETCHIFRHFRY